MIELMDIFFGVMLVLLLFVCVCVLIFLIHIIKDDKEIRRIREEEKNAIIKKLQEDSE